MKYLKDIFLNRLGWIFILANAVLLLWGMYDKGIGHRGFHLVYEPLAIQLFVLLNLPAIFVSETILDIAATRPEVTSTTTHIDNLTFFSLLPWVCIQWLLLGWLFSSRAAARDSTAALGSDEKLR